MCKHYLIMMMKLFFSKKRKLLKSDKEQFRSKNIKLQDSFMYLWFYPAAEADTFSSERPVIQRMTAAATAVIEVQKLTLKTPSVCTWDWIPCFACPFIFTFTATFEAGGIVPLYR